MPRTTLRLRDDALRVAKQHARRRRLSLGDAVSELVCRAAERPLLVDGPNGFKVVNLPAGSPKVMAEQIYKLLDEPW